MSSFDNWRSFNKVCLSETKPGRRMIRIEKTIKELEAKIDRAKKNQPRREHGEHRRRRFWKYACRYRCYGKLFPVLNYCFYSGGKMHFRVCDENHEENDRIFLEWDNAVGVAKTDVALPANKSWERLPWRHDSRNGLPTYGHHSCDFNKDFNAMLRGMNGAMNGDRFDRDRMTGLRPRERYRYRRESDDWGEYLEPCGWRAVLEWKITCRKKEAKKLELMHDKDVDAIRDYRREQWEKTPEYAAKLARSDAGGYVYVFHDPNPPGDVYKVGMSKNPKQRLKGLSSTVVDDWEVVAVREAKDAAKTEAEWHDRFGGARCLPRKELFRLTREMLSEFLDQGVNGPRGVLCDNKEVLGMGFESIYVPALELATNAGQG